MLLLPQYFKNEDYKSYKFWQNVFLVDSLFEPCLYLRRKQTPIEWRSIEWQNNRMTAIDKRNKENKHQSNDETIKWQPMIKEIREQLLQRYRHFLKRYMIESCRNPDQVFLFNTFRLNAPFFYPLKRSKDFTVF